PADGLLNPNHFLAVAIRYLLTHRPGWRAGAAVGETLGSSSMIDRGGQTLGREVGEGAGGVKGFAPGPVDGSCWFGGGGGRGGRRSLGKEGRVGPTDKAGPFRALRAAEITAATGKAPGEHYRELPGQFGQTFYPRIDPPATPEQKAKLARLSPADVTAGK